MVKLGDWLSEGWALIKDDLITFAVAALVAGLIGTFTLLICMPAMMVGILMMVNKRMRGEAVAIGDVFLGFQKFGAAFVAGLLFFLAVCIASAILGMIPILGWIVAPIVSPFLGFLVGGALFYMFPIIAEQSASGVDAIRMSWEATKPQYIMYVVTQLVYSLVAMVGFALCLIPGFVTLPLSMAAYAVAYRDTFGMQAAGAPPQAPPTSPQVPPTPPTPPTPSA